jgi:hypothetical protein
MAELKGLAGVLFCVPQSQIVSGRRNAARERLRSGAGGTADALVPWMEPSMSVPSSRPKTAYYPFRIS